MVKTTIIARITDGLPLAASMDDEQVKGREGEKRRRV
jgi:vesicle transport protein SEC22